MYGAAEKFFPDMGLCVPWPEDMGRGGGSPRRNPHQQECKQVAPPVGGALLHDQAANQDRGAIGVVSDLLWKFGHPRSIDSAGIDRASGLKRNDSLPAISGFFKPNKDLHETRF